MAGTLHQPRAKTRVGVTPHPPESSCRSECSISGIDPPGGKLGWGASVQALERTRKACRMVQTEPGMRVSRAVFPQAYVVSSSLVLLHDCDSRPAGCDSVPLSDGACSLLLDHVCFVAMVRYVQLSGNNLPRGKSKYMTRMTASGVIRPVCAFLITIRKLTAVLQLKA